MDGEEEQRDKQEGVLYEVSCCSFLLVDSTCIVLIARSICVDSPAPSYFLNWVAGGPRFEMELDSNH